MTLESNKSGDLLIAAALFNVGDGATGCCQGKVALATAVVFEELGTS